MGEVIVRSRTGSKQMSVQIGSTTIEVDRSEGNREIRSVDFLLAALGSCTLATLSHYMQRKGMESEIKINVTSTREEGQDHYGSIAVLVDVGEVDERTKMVLKSIGKTCTIHKTLHAHPEISIDIV